jgi:hypothetical protein
MLRLPRARAARGRCNNGSVSLLRRILGVVLLLVGLVVILVGAMAMEPLGSPLASFWAGSSSS